MVQQACLALTMNRRRELVRKSLMLLVNHHHLHPTVKNPLKGNELDLAMSKKDVGGVVHVFMIDATESTLPPETTGIRNPGARRRSDSPPAPPNRSRESSSTRSVIQGIRQDLHARWVQWTEQGGLQEPLLTETQQAQQFSDDASYGAVRTPSTIVIDWNFDDPRA